MSHRSANLAAEGILIVASILAAFAIDAWWADRQERIEERRILGSLKAEFQLNADQIPAFARLHAQSAEASSALVRAMQGAGPGGAFEFSVLQVAMTLVHGSTDPHRGALDAILQSGELRYIRNPQIRERLAAWPRLVVDATENEVLLRRTWGPLLHAALGKQADLSAIDVIADECWQDNTGGECAQSYISLRHSTEVIAFLLPIRGYSSEAAKELALLADEARDIAALIDEELGR